MKKITLLTSMLLICTLPFYSYGQAKKYPLVEEYTQASCGPCGQQNPGYEANILEKNNGKMHQISYHTSWPGTDPMNTYNATDVATRVSYYNINGVPTIQLLGSYWTGQPGTITQGDIDGAASQSSPIRIKVDEVHSGINRNVTVTVYTVGTPPTGNLKLRTAVVEDPIDYTTAPGSNGETHFPDVFRKMLPNVSGDTYTPAVTGDSVVFNYTYALDTANWDTSNVHVIAFVQDDQTKEVLNSGSPTDPKWEMDLMSPNAKEGSSGTASTFNVNLLNMAVAQGNYRIKFTAVQPSGWSADYTYNSGTYTDSMDVTLGPNSTTALAINVTPGATAGVGRYTVSMQSLDDTSMVPQVLEMYVMSGVTDLIVDNDAGVGDGSAGTAARWDSVYTKAFATTSCTTYAVTDSRAMISLMKNNAFTGVKDIYLNIGWTFPSFTNEMVAQLSTFLNNGGRMFTSGQDIGWDTWGGSANGANGTAATQAFYTNYLCANWIADGDATNSQLTAVPGGLVFGSVASSPIIDYYGGGNLYPDQVAAATNGVPIFYYNADTSRVAGVRAENGTWETVYLGVGIEMLSNDTAAAQIINQSYMWFNGLTSTQDFDNAMRKLSLGQNFPNPSDVTTTIPFKNLNKDVTLQVLDLTGRVIMQRPIAKGTKAIRVNTLGLDAGMYMYRLADGTHVTNAKPMEVLH